MAFKIGGTIGKLANNAKKLNGKDALLTAANPLIGQASAAKKTATGKGLVEATSGLSTMMGTDVNGANQDAYLGASNNLLNPVADQYSQFGQTSGITSNVDPAFRNYQLGLAAQLQAQASGQGPSLAQMQLKQATDRTLNQSLGNIRAATGANAGLSARTAALAGAQGLGAAANQSGQLRLQEQQTAQQQLANVAGAGRSGDLTANGQSIQAQTATQNNRLAGIQGLGGIRTSQLDAQGRALGYDQQAALQESQNKNQRANQIGGSILGGLSTAFAAK